MTAPAPVALTRLFADALPELTVPWQGADAPAPRLLVLDEGLADELGLDAAWLRSEAGLRLLLGQQAPDGARPVAQAYAGHQFGGFVPRLGDGRALLLGELTDRAGRVRDLHLKGSGRTPFSRGGDGYAAVGPMLREHVVSTAMHALGVPTTRSLAVVATGRPVRRETVQPGAVLARTASSHLRVGSVQYARTTGDPGVLDRLVRHALQRHAPQGLEAERPALALLEHVVAVQAPLVARWMLLGFVHGVLNTDNLTLSGETIDYGPCAFLDGYDPSAVFSSIDEGGRYAYGNQPLLVEWGLARLAEALLPLLADEESAAVEVATQALTAFRPRYAAAWAAGVRAKLGLPEGLPDDLVTALGEELLSLLAAGRSDLTGTLRRLSGVPRGDVEPVRSRVLDLPGFDAWCERWRALGPDPELMDRSNPVYVPRNHLVEEALTAAAVGEDLGPVERLLQAVADPFHERPGLERYAEPGPDVPYTTFCGT